ncbi:MAG: hypothetical protein K1000chlam2_01595 [Chlamydiae bacterium]|nr:hypothetical protein [Chlamydiota bacterium]
MRYIIYLVLFCLPLAAQESDHQQLYLSLNIDEGKYLQLSDGSTYEIDPDDRLYSSYWITPFPLMISKSDNSEYPVRITNLNTDTGVNGKQVKTKEVIEEESKEHAKQTPHTPTPEKEKSKPKTSPQTKSTQ